jgi:hypothetical protein
MVDGSGIRQYNGLEVTVEDSMPRICAFFGIVIRMFYNDHSPPHFHAEYGEHEAVYEITL